MLHHCIHCLIPSKGFCFYFCFKTLFCLFIDILNNNSLVSCIITYSLLRAEHHIVVIFETHFCRAMHSLLKNDRNIFKFYFFFSTLNFLFRFLVNEKLNQVESWVLVIILQHMCTLSAIHHLTHTFDFRTLIYFLKFRKLLLFTHSPCSMFHVNFCGEKINSFECPGIKN